MHVQAPQTRRARHEIASRRWSPAPALLGWCPTYDIVTKNSDQQLKHNAQFAAPRRVRVVVEVRLANPRIGQVRKSSSTTTSPMTSSSCGRTDVVEYSSAAGFSVEKLQKITDDYVRTLDIWSQQREAARDEAVAVTSTEVYDRYMRYLIGCSDFFQRNICEVGQFTLVK
jgi:Mycolic acid cyclopropane synthetase